MTVIDHFYILIIAVIHPVAGYFSYQRLLKRVAAGQTVDRSQLYGLTAIGHWTLFAMAIAIWAGGHRDWAELGFGLEINGGFLAAVAITVVCVALLIVQLKQVSAADADELNNYRSQFGSVEIILPRNGNELGRFNLLAVTAGIVEETIWRGFLIWYLSHVMPVWAAAIVSTIGFGIAHAYQGAANIPRIILVGAVFAALYVVSGSLWLPMIMHAAVDLLQGRLAYQVIQRTEPTVVCETQ